MSRKLNLNTDDVTDQTTTVILDSVEYVFRLRFSSRAGWQLSIYDPDLYDYDAVDNTEAKLYGERRLMPNQDFFKFVNGSDSLPTGVLMLFDDNEPSTQDYELPTRYNLGQGKRFTLNYFTNLEISELL